MNIIETFALPPIVSFDYEGDMNVIFDYVNEAQLVKRKTKKGAPIQDTHHQSRNHYVLDELDELRDFCKKSSEEYCKEICDVDCEIDIQQSWLNVNEKGDSFTDHWHANSYLSGCFYIQSDTKKGAPIRFHSSLKNFSYYPTPREGIQRDWVSDRRNRYTTTKLDVASIPGKLLLFSSLMTHSVPVNNSDESRVSLSFNTTPTRPFGSEDRLKRIT